MKCIEIMILEEMKKLISFGWCQKWDAKNIMDKKCYAVSLDEGKHIIGVNSRAESFCLAGALYAAEYNYPGHSYNIDKRLDRKTKYVCGGFVKWNDEEFRTKKQVISLLDEVIKEIEIEINNEQLARISSSRTAKRLL